MRHHRKKSEAVGASKAREELRDLALETLTTLTTHQSPRYARLVESVGLQLARSGNVNRWTNKNSWMSWRSTTRVTG